MAEEYNGLTVEEIIDTIRCRQRYKFIKHFLGQGYDSDTAIDMMNTAMVHYRRGQLHERLRRQQQPNIVQSHREGSPISDPDPNIREVERMLREQQNELNERIIRPSDIVREEIDNLRRREAELQGHMAQEHIRRRQDDAMRRAREMEERARGLEQRANERMERQMAGENPVARGRGVPGRSPFTATELAAMAAAQEREQNQRQEQYREIVSHLDTLQARIFHLQHRRRQGRRDGWNQGEIDAVDRDISAAQGQFNALETARREFEQPMQWQPQFGVTPSMVPGGIVPGAASV